MKHFLLILSLSIIPNQLWSKGGSGVYRIQGKAYSETNGLIKNQELIVVLGESKDTVSTDSLGNFDIAIPWSTACPSAYSQKERAQHNRKINPETINIHWRDQSIEIKNQWKKFMSLTEEIVYEKDLHFEG